MNRETSHSANATSSFGSCEAKHNTAPCKVPSGVVHHSSVTPADFLPYARITETRVRAALDEDIHLIAHRHRHRQTVHDIGMVSNLRQYSCRGGATVGTSTIKPDQAPATRGPIFCAGNRSQTVQVPIITPHCLHSCERIASAFQGPSLP
jgi:hypothetical protein